MSLVAPFVLLAAALSPAPPITISVDLANPSHPISRDLFGVFFEEINHSGDGGLNAELLRNFNFHEVFAGMTSIPGWVVEPGDGNGKASTTIGGLHIMRKSVGGAALGATNAGYWGVAVEKGERYRYACSCFSGYESPFHLRLIGSNGKILADTTATSSLYWGDVKGVLTPTETDDNAKLEVSLDKVGEVSIRSISLMPAKTWQGLGMRTDLSQMVSDLHPAFVRFPGGCYVEGGDFLRNRFKWETTLQPRYLRPGHLNSTWGYWSTDTLGYDEYLRWCESLGASALYVINAGFSHKETVPLSELDGYLNSTLDALEYALGSGETLMGSKRIANGHPNPYPLRYVEIGNENGQQGWKTGGTPEDYLAHYKRFAALIRRRYPDLQLIGDSRIAAGADLVDDHYYHSPDWFWSNVGLYDKTSRQGPKVYVGEYAVTSDCGHGNLRAALAEAAFMTGLERNSDLVKMASYAPLFVNVHDRAWNPDAIAFDGLHAYGTPSYWVQKLFGENRGSQLLPVTVDGTTKEDRFAVDAAANPDHDVIIKLVNGGPEREADLRLPGWVGNYTLDRTWLTSENDADENSLTEPTKVAPQSHQEQVSVAETLRVTVPAHALVILRLHKN